MKDGPISQEFEPSPHHRGRKLSLSRSHLAEHVDNSRGVLLQAFHVSLHVLPIRVAVRFRRQCQLCLFHFLLAPFVVVRVWSSGLPEQRLEEQCDFLCQIEFRIEHVDVIGCPERLRLPEGFSCGLLPVVCDSNYPARMGDDRCCRHVR